VKKQTVIWTALPSGVIGGTGGTRLQLSVMVSPRLQTNEGLPKPELAQFPDFLNWPATAKQFSVRFGNGLVLPATVISAAPSSDLWGRLFKPTTYVRPFEFKNLATRRIRSFPTRHIMSFIKQQYSEMATQNAAAYPDVETLSSRKSFGLIANYFGRQSPTRGDFDPDQQLRNEHEEILTKNKAVPPSATANPRGDFFQLREFYKPSSASRLALKVPDIDFHQVVASLGDFPEVMRRLGLVLDLEVPMDGAIPPSSTVEVSVVWSPRSNATTDVTPRTNYTLDGLTFAARPRPANPDLSGGMLDLSDTNTYHLMQLDVDGAGLKAADFANTLIRGQVHRTADTPNRQPAPALRTGGLQLAASGRALRLVRALETSAQINTAAEGGAPPELYAEDLTRGYRVDVYDGKASKWRSLCRRVGQYHFKDGEITLTHEDEGYVSMGVTESADGSSTDLYLHESLLRWEGWSLVATRPGRMIDNEDTVQQAENKAHPDFGLEASFKAAPRTLPRLRFGNTYRLKARAVDLAGNSLPLDPTSADFSKASEEMTYRRFDPIANPAVVLKHTMTEGESAERLVIRSNYDVASVEASERHIAPPRVAQLTAELHGMFDSPDGLDQAAYDAIIAKDAPFADGVHAEEELALPYLPDPIARGATLVGLPGALPIPLTQVDYGGGLWPGALPFRIRVEEGSGQPAFDPTTRVLTVKAPKAEIAKVRLSSYIDRADLELMGVWQWIKERGLTPAQLAAFEKIVAWGIHWMVTPYRELTLVHAVKQPMEIPSFVKLHMDRGLGDTFAWLNDTMTVHGKSTIKVDVQAEWQEPVDPLAEPKWKLIGGRAQAAEIPVDYGFTQLTLHHKHSFGDTKYRRVKYTAVGTTRFAEYFQERATENVALSGTTAKLLANGPFVAGSDEVTSPDGNTAYQRDVDYTADPKAGSIARIAGGAIGNGSVVQIGYAYIPGSITRAMETPVELDVLSSSRPAAPKVLYVVPTFGWSQEDIEDGVAVRRVGGLRVYMERPWFSSGDGELLGAVLWPGPSRVGRLPILPIFGVSNRPPEALKPYVTQWGMDPIWLTAQTYAVPSASHFKKAVAVGTGLTLDELPAATKVSVAGHTVGYDEERKLWYCDMEIDAGPSYWPFVRLALARYQPKSVDGAHLSRVVLTDFAQIAPDRLVSMVGDPEFPTKLAITVCGPGYTRGPVGRFPSELEVSVETRRPNVADGDLGWMPAGPAPVALTLQVGGDPKNLNWNGLVELPAARGTKPYRLVVKEYERFLVDAGAGSPNSIAANVPTQRRLVFAAVLEL